MKALVIWTMAFSFVFSVAIAEERCARLPTQTEQSALLAAGSNVMRDGAKLRMRTKNGLVEMTDTDCSGVGPTENCQKFIFSGEPREGLYLVRINYYEGSRYALIDQATGKVQGIDGFPWFSPNRQKFLVTTGSITYEPDTLEVWNISNGDFTLEWSNPEKINQPPDAGPPTQQTSYCFQKWLDNDHVLLQAAIWRGYDRDTDRLSEFDVLLILGHSHWIVTRATP